MFTSTFTWVNHMMNPDKQAREMWYRWFEKFWKLAANLLQKYWVTFWDPDIPYIRRKATAGVYLKESNRMLAKAVFSD